MESPEIFNQRMESHRAFVSRQWQYFAAYLLLNGFLLNAAKDLIEAESALLFALTLASIITSGVFFHLIGWTRMKIFRNAWKIEVIAGREVIELPGRMEGITPWLQIAVVSFTACWIYWSWQLGVVQFLVAVIAFAVPVVFSSVICHRWLNRDRHTRSLQAV